MQPSWIAMLTAASGTITDAFYTYFDQEAHVLVLEKPRMPFCVLRFFAPARNVTPPHTHRATDEVFVVESGEVSMRREFLGNDDLRVVVLSVPGVVTAWQLGLPDQLLSVD
jgi:mannose-6-phosphate isomerase-like protein (cupin superfamily)